VRRSIDRRALLPASLVLLACLLAGCAGLGAATPEHAVRNAVEASWGAGAGASVQVLGTRPATRGTLVLYSGWMPARGDRPATAMTGYYLVEFQPRFGGWYAGTGGAGGSSAGAASVDELITRGAGRGGSPDGGLSIVYGIFLSNEVNAVEATFNNGQVVRDRPKDGAYAMFVEEIADWCEIRVLGHEGQVLETIRPEAEALLKAASGDRPSQCPQ
jgi:hypothetical protein